MAILRKANITICQGTTFNPILTVKDENGNIINLSGYTAKMQMRVTTFSPDTLFNLTTENGGITLGGSAGTVALYISATDTSLLSQNGVYDLKIFAPSSVVSRWLQGAIIISQQVSK